MALLSNDRVGLKSSCTHAQTKRTQNEPDHALPARRSGGEAAAGAGGSKGELLALILAEGILMTAGRSAPEAAEGVSCEAVHPEAGSALSKLAALTGMPHTHPDAA